MINELQKKLNEEAKLQLQREYNILKKDIAKLQENYLGGYNDWVTLYLDKCYRSHENSNELKFRVSELLQIIIIHAFNRQLLEKQEKYTQEFIDRVSTLAQEVDEIHDIVNDLENR